MAITADYDAPRRNTLEEADTESLDTLTTAAKTAAQYPDVDLDESDTAEGIELPGADLSGGVLTMPVIPQQAMSSPARRVSWFTTAAGSPPTPPDGWSASTAPDAAGREFVPQVAP